MSKKEKNLKDGQGNYYVKIWIEGEKYPLYFCGWLCSYAHKEKKIAMKFPTKKKAKHFWKHVLFKASSKEQAYACIERQCGGKISKVEIIQDGGEEKEFLSEENFTPIMLILQDGFSSSISLIKELGERNNIPMISYFYSSLGEFRLEELKRDISSLYKKLDKNLTSGRRMYVFLYPEASLSPTETYEFFHNVMEVLPLLKREKSYLLMVTYSENLVDMIGGIRKREEENKVNGKDSLMEENDISLIWGNDDNDIHQAFYDYDGVLTDWCVGFFDPKINNDGE